VSQPRLLIVEDDEAIQTQLKYVLRDEFSLAFAGDRTQALARLREAQPPVVPDRGAPGATCQRDGFRGVAGWPREGVDIRSDTPLRSPEPARLRSVSSRLPP
jgi:hypothetical protein